MIAKDKILVIDDEPEMLEAIQGALSSRGYRVFTAADGDQGLRTAETELPDLIVTDLLMPVLDGWHFCQRIKEHPTCARTPVILVSAVVDDHIATSDIELGDCYISKPFTMSKLLTAIKDLLQDEDRKE